MGFGLCTESKVALFVKTVIEHLHEAYAALSDRLCPQADPSHRRHHWRSRSRRFLKSVLSNRNCNLCPLVWCDALQFSVLIQDGGPNPRSFKVRLTEAAQINFHELGRFLQQQQGMTSNVLMCINALNVALTHEATLKWPSRVNFVFPLSATGRQQQQQDQLRLSGGYTATRGLWFSVRPSMSGLVVNVDTSAGVFYNEGTLPDVVAAYLNTRVQDIPNIPDRTRVKLKHWLFGVKVGAPIQGVPGRTYGEFKIKVRVCLPALVAASWRC